MTNDLTAAEFIKKVKKYIPASKAEHRALALWAAECAEHVLPFFEKERPEDTRPRKAVAAVRAWVKGKQKLMEVRKAALASHKAARGLKSASALATARAAGHAAATAHVTSHAVYAARYAISAAETLGFTNEQDWQYECFLKHLPLVKLF